MWPRFREISGWSRDRLWADVSSQGVSADGNAMLIPTGHHCWLMGPEIKATGALVA
jgi:hypothetical protein